MKTTVILTKLLSITMIFSLSLAISCTTDKEPIDVEIGENNFKGVKIPITITGGCHDNDTKVSYTDNETNYLFSWNVNDKISLSVYDGSSNNLNNEFTATTAATSTQFTGEVTTWAGAQNVYAVYPYSGTGYTVTDGDDIDNATIHIDMSHQTITSEKTTGMPTLSW